MAFSLSLAPFPSAAFAQDAPPNPERAWSRASGPFDNPLRSPGAAAAAEVPPQTPPVPPLAREDRDVALKILRRMSENFHKLRRDPPPKGLGPANSERDGSYGSGLWGGLLGLLLAPLAFALELVQAVALTPVRMARGLAKGDWSSLLEPLRTAKNIAQDAVATAVGIANCAAAPVWNAFRPDQATDFVYADHRLIFVGGPIGGLMDAYRDPERGTAAAGMAPSWHDVFASRRAFGPYQTVDRSNLWEHEYVHNKQWEHSFLFEKVGESYNGYKDWRPEDAKDYLNW